MYLVLRDLNKLEKEIEMTESNDTTKRLDADYTEDEFRSFLARPSTVSFMRALFRTLHKGNTISQYGMWDYEKMDMEKRNHYEKKAHCHLTSALGPEYRDVKVDYKGGQPLHERHNLIAIARLLPVVIYDELNTTMKDMEEINPDD